MNKRTSSRARRIPAASSGGTSWQNVSEWYGRLVGEEGHYYHQHIILPKSLKLLNLNPESSLLDLACGQGVLGRAIPPEVFYTGIDSAPDLISKAKRLDNSRKHVYLIADITGVLPLKQKFSHTAIILALQNIAAPEKVIANATEHLQTGGRFLIVINHPCFRIPRQSSWGTDEANKLEYRRINRYLSAMKIPINVSPSKGERGEVVWTYHVPISEYSRTLAENGFIIERLEEWVSDKSSAGSVARMENRARREFPLFMAILARKDSG